MPYAKCYAVLLISKSTVKVGRTVLKKDRLDYVKSYWKGSEIYRFSRSATPNFLHRPSMMVKISEDFEPPYKKFLAMSLHKKKNIVNSFAN